MDVIADVSKQDLLNAGGREAWIEMQRRKGELKRAERDALKGASGNGNGTGTVNANGDDDGGVSAVDQP
jgi:hypothetical protein